jgi:hypothetical protein
MILKLKTKDSINTISSLALSRVEITCRTNARQAAVEEMDEDSFTNVLRRKRQDSEFRLTHLLNQNRS